MRRIILKGGYGEHGRSCFLVEYGTRGRYYMVDCGIMDTDPFPFPQVGREELETVDYLFLTHCHKDHSGAFSHLVENGFSGVLVTTEMTYGLAKLEYEKRLFLPVRAGIGMVRADGLAIRYGRSGHCPGGLWFYLEDAKGRLFFSGDYQEASLFYACDRAEGLRAELAVADCAHNGTGLSAGELRETLLQSVERDLLEGRPVIFPVPQYGRGPELFYLLKDRFPGRRILFDERFLEYSKEMLREAVWYRKEAFEKAERGGFFTPGNAKPIAQPGPMDFDVLLIADTHLKQPENQAFVRRAAEAGAACYVTGRVKPGSLPDQLLKEKKAVRFSFPHHQSRGDLAAMVGRNRFSVVLPFHNNEKAVLLGTGPF